MSPLTFAIGLWLAAGLTGFAVWTVRVYTTTHLAQNPDWTSWLIHTCGRAFIWLAAVLAAGAIFGVAARAAWRLLAE
jgi:hypothetical protein